jgi:Family of unknown function (DUF6085)
MTGHGHVIPNPDGSKARCGGPVLCSVCARELATLQSGRGDDRHVEGYCPFGCGETLVLAAGGHVTCSHLDCPRRDAVADLLRDSETEHVVTFGETDFAMLHPLRERFGPLEDCALHEHIKAMSGPPVQPGKYRARHDGERWTWEAVPS